MRQTVGHVEDSGHTARCGSPTLGGEVALVRQSRVAEVHVVVDDARQQVAACAVDDFVDGCERSGIAFNDFFNAVVVNDQRACKAAALVDKGHVLYLSAEVHVFSFFMCFGGMGRGRLSLES